MTTGRFDSLFLGIMQKELPVARLTATVTQPPRQRRANLKYKIYNKIFKGFVSLKTKCTPEVTF